MRLSEALGQEFDAHVNDAINRVKDKELREAGLTDELLKITSG